MKCAIITDTHFSCRQDSLFIHNYFEKFYSNTFFPTLKERGISTILHLGDVFDKRKSIDFQSLYLSSRYFFEPLNEFKVHMIAGNHDCFHKNTNEINSPSLLTKQYSNIKTYQDPTEIELDGLKILLLPWICSENFERSMKYIHNSPATVVMGHFDMQGFNMSGGRISDIGFTISDFDRFHMVFSGHYHHKSVKENITYLGNPYQLTWEDYGDIRGFHIFDTSTFELEFVENPYTLFDKIFYDDSNRQQFDFERYKDKFIKVVVINKNDSFTFDKFLDSLYFAGVYDVKIIEQVVNISNSSNNDLVVEDTVSLINDYVDKLDGISCDKSILKKKVLQLYNESINLEI